MKFSECAELPRERLLQYGIEQLTDVELIAIILQTGKKGEHVLDMSRRVLTYLKKNKIHSPQQLQNLTNIGLVKASKLFCALHLQNRIYTLQAQTSIRNSQEAALYFKELEQTNVEECKLLFLDTKNKVIRQYTASRGGLNKAVIQPREIFRNAIAENAASIIMAHNHPSGDCEPSKEDKELTQLFEEAGELLGIPVIDHIIIGKKEYYSFADNATHYQQDNQENCIMSRQD